MTRDSQKLATKIVGEELSRITTLQGLLYYDEFKSEYEKLFQQIRRERQDELDDTKESAHPEILQEFAAEAGFLVGLEIGRRLAGLR